MRSAYSLRPGVPLFSIFICKSVQSGPMKSGFPRIDGVAHGEERLRGLIVRVEQQGALRSTVTRDLPWGRSGRQNISLARLGGGGGTTGACVAAGRRCSLSGCSRLPSRPGGRFPEDRGPAGRLPASQLWASVTPQVTTAATAGSLTITSI